MKKEERLLFMINNDKTSTIAAVDKEGNPKLSKEGKQLMVNVGRDKIMIEEYLKEEQRLRDELEEAKNKIKSINEEKALKEKEKKFEKATSKDITKQQAGVDKK